MKNKNEVKIELIVPDVKEISIQVLNLSNESRENRTEACFSEHRD